MSTAATHATDHVARNTTYMTVALVFQKLLSFFYYAFLARSIGDVSLGKYTFALSFASIFIIFMDFGLGPVLTREGARDQTVIGDYVSRILGLKIILVVLSLVAMFVALPIINHNGSIPADTIELTALAALIIILDTFTFTFYSVFRAMQNLRYETCGIMIYQTIIVALGIGALLLGLPLPAIIGAIIVGSIFHCIWSLTWLRKRAGIVPKLALSWPWVKKLLVVAAPFAFAGIFFKLNGSIDTVMLETLAGEKYVGWYSVAFKLTFALTVLPGAFATSFYPAMSYYFTKDQGKLAHLFERSLFYLILISFPIATIAGLLAQQIVTYIYGPVFSAAGLALVVFMASLPFVFCNYPIGNLLNACNRQTVNTINMGIALTANVVLNIFLIPRYTFMGAAIAGALSSVLLVILGLPWIRSLAPYSTRFVLSKLARVIGASIVTGLFLFMIDGQLHFLVAAPVALVVYLLGLFVFRGLTSDEVMNLVRIIKRDTLA